MVQPDREKNSNDERLEHAFIELTKLDREAFAEALLQPSLPSKKSIKAAHRYKERLGL